MLSKWRLKNRFILEVALFISLLLSILSAVLYNYSYDGVFSNLRRNLIQEYSYFLLEYKDEISENSSDNLYYEIGYSYKVQVLTKNGPISEGFFTNLEENIIYFIENIPYIPAKYIKITKNILLEQHILDNLFIIILLISGLSIIFTLLYMSFVIRRLIKPTEILTSKLTNMNESILQQIDLKDLSEEFYLLGNSINILITKIQTSINYRKELYVGTAHEFKTPLAVMRLKNQITLVKYNRTKSLDHNSIIDTFNQTIESIDNLNNMIHNILEYGRAEAAQFEQPRRIDLIKFIAKKAEEYELLAHSYKKNFIYYFEVETFIIQLQPILFMQIFQNFFQNALNYTKEGGEITLYVYMDDVNFIIEIKDEGPGIDDNKNLFTPFLKSQESKGTGLGLFLAQNSAESMRATIKLKNRKDKKGAVASIIFPLKTFY